LQTPSTRFFVIQSFLEIKSRKGKIPKPPAKVDDPRERGFFTQLLQGMVRHELLLEEELTRRIRRRKKLQGAVSAIIKLGFFELLFMERIPARASIHQAGWLAERFRVSAAKPLINGVLRKFLTELDQGYDPEKEHHFNIYESIPAWMLQRWEKDYGEIKARNLAKASNRFPGIHLTLHFPEKRNLVTKEFSNLSIAFEPHSLIPEMFVLQDGKGFLKTEAFQKGWISVSDPASVLFMLWAEPFFQGRVLDVCAAPGGKSLKMASFDKVSALYLNDLSHSRMKKIHDNIQRTRLTPSGMMQSDGSQLPFRNDQFDTVFIDAPCSSTGTIQKNPDIKWTTSEKELLKNLDLQAQLLDEGARVLKPGGTLIYSTCSMEKEENQNQVQLFLGRQSGFFLKHRSPESTLAQMDEWMYEPKPYFQILSGPLWGGFFGVALGCH
jgi:16S rRNA (cytosine967-C5)-methyltransferase